MTTLSSRLIVSILDNVSAPSRAIAASVGNMRERLDENNQRMDAMRGRMLEAAAVAYGLARAVQAPLKAATAFETQLEDIGQKANIPIAQLPQLGAEIRAVAREVSQSATDIASGMDVLTGMGANRSDALGMSPAIGRAATAYNASIADLSQAGYAALTNLKVPAENFTLALDAMAAAGKSGAFELKDMAQHFPALGAGYQALGQQGVDAVADLAAALQVVRMGTGDSASAATNLTNVLQKIGSPATARAFKKMGVSLETEMKRASERGLTPIEAIAEVTNKALKGDLSRLGYLFEDAQVQQGLRAIMQNMEEYRRIRAEAMEAQGVVEEDYQRRLETGAMAARRFGIAMENINLAIGTALLPALANLGDILVPIINRMAAFAEANPGLTQAVVASAAGLVALRVAALAAQFSLLWMRGAVLTSAIAGLKGLGSAVKLTGAVFTPLAATLRAARATMIGFAAAAAVNGTGGALKLMATSLLGLLNPLRLVRAAMIGLKYAFIGTGIGAVVVALAIAGTWIARNWAGIKEMFAGIGEGLRAAFPGLAPIIDGISTAVGTLFGWLEKLTRPMDATSEDWRAMGVQAGQTIGEIIAVVAELPGRIIALLSGIDLAGIGRSIMNSLLSGLKAGATAVLDYISDIGSRIKSSISSAASGAWSRVKSAVGMGEVPALAGARAAGGPVVGGRTYLVGEEGPELITPSRSGHVHTANDTAGMLGGGLSLGSLIGELHVHPSPGMNEQALAEKTARLIDKAVRDAFSGGHWNGGYRVA